MENTSLKLLEQRHPNKEIARRYQQLQGLELHQSQLLRNLHLFFDPAILNRWQKEHHPNGISFLNNGSRFSPLILLSGDVGCGKTELAQTVGTPLTEVLGGKTVVTFETPSDIRGKGHVGELSSRITAAFSYAKGNLRQGQVGILIIDEADDLATSRDQNAAHHEDRAGVDVLIKEIDRIEREEIPLAIMMITNRFKALDPAIVRRASIQLEFVRPNSETIKKLLEAAFEGLGFSDKEINKVCKVCAEKSVPFTYSDLTKRMPRICLSKALDLNEPITSELIIQEIIRMNPSPPIL